MPDAGFKEAKSHYESTVDKTLPKNPERRAAFTTGGGIPLERLYDPESIAG